jgi:hypothetical protein
MATFNDYVQFKMSKTETQREFRTIEIHHPDLDMVYRFVQDNVDLIATLESTAPRDAGATVTFSAAAIEIVEPAESTDSEQNLQVNIGTLDDKMHQIMDQITGKGFLTQVDLVYRKYYSIDLSEPIVNPLYLFINQPSFDGLTAASFDATDTDLSLKRAGTIYTLEDFPGLA